MAWSKILCKRNSTKSRRGAMESAQAVAKGSVNSTVGEHDLQLAEHQVPVLASGAPALRNALGGQVKHPAQGIIVGKAGFVFRNLPELEVEAFNDIRRI